MYFIQVSRTIPNAIDKVWPLLANIDLIHKIHPMVATSPIIGDQHEGVGATRMCNLYNGMQAVETITAVKFQECVTIEIVESKMPFKRAYGEFYTQALADEKTLVIVKMYMTPKYGLLGEILYHVLLKYMMQKVLKSVLLGLETHLQTGKIVGRNGRLEDEKGVCGEGFEKTIN